MGLLWFLNLYIPLTHKLWKIFIHNHFKYYLVSFASPSEIPIKYLLFACHCPPTKVSFVLLTYILYSLFVFLASFQMSSYSGVLLKFLSLKYLFNSKPKLNEIYLEIIHSQELGNFVLRGQVVNVLGFASQGARSRVLCRLCRLCRLPHKHLTNI